MISKTPEPPYYAVIFTSTRTEGDHDYAAVSDHMMQLAEKQPGFLGVEHARDTIGITVSYWQDLESIKNWKHQAEHTRPKPSWPRSSSPSFKVRIAKVERDYEFEK